MPAAIRRHGSNPSRPQLRPHHLRRLPKAAPPPISQHHPLHRLHSPPQIAQFPLFAPQESRPPLLLLPPPAHPPPRGEDANSARFQRRRIGFFSLCFEAVALRFLLQMGEMDTPKRLYFDWRDASGWKGFEVF